ncbi:ABC transporter permease [Halalkalibacter krulwichiae]|uniref:ABC-2 family transporter protein n=1 Tax=Halalkalibacter krulwichiae TaxID=199441 RepID=A0A1X9M8T8_9BACI|nr:ABC transporter permease [Halalkalibacter krulwichiae]ARK29835.1 ABC-2 family transporter protein [Halalkalibacter krulwichiae]
MLNIIRFIQNENMKIYKRIGTWVMVGVLILTVVIGGLVTKYMMNVYETEDWQLALQTENQQLTDQIAQLNDMEMGSAAQPLHHQISINEYRITNNVPPVESGTLWGFMMTVPDFTALASVFVIVIGAGIVAGEFSTGTIKLLLIRPVNRFKILLSKYIATLLFAVVLLALLFLSSFAVGRILFGFGGGQLPYLVYNGEEVVERSMITQIMSFYAFNSIDLVMMVTFAFMISTVFRSGSMAIGLSLFLMFTGGQVVQLFNQYDWVKYILFTHTNLSQYNNGTPIVEGMTMSYSIMMLCIYFILFIGISFITFQKRDVVA